MNSQSVVDRLAALPDLASVPREQLEWVAEHGDVHHGEDGFTLRGIEAMVGLIVLISGRFSVRVEEHGVEREVREITPGGVTGSLPFSKMTTPRGYLVADGPVEFVLVAHERFREMASECYELTGVCVQAMLARVRVFKAEDKHQEKLAALGRLSAGLAHELNNPASALVRDAGELEASRLEVAGASRALGSADLDEEARAAVEALEAVAVGGADATLTPVERASVEDEVMDWLEARGLDPDLAYPLTEAGVSVDDLDAAAQVLGPDRLKVVVRYISAGAAARSLADDILTASTRIHTLVAAVKKHTQMDRASVAEPLRLEEHIPDAVTLLGSRASLKEISVELDVDDELPPVVGVAADLNQVWMHLIDNAIDAAPEGGRINVHARAGHDVIEVSVVDDGPGIPAEDLERVFEPFFTTKDVGQGRGLGLDVVRTVVRAHKGVVELSSRPGRTEFRVTLPATRASTGEGEA